jgi:hypothetical protein
LDDNREPQCHSTDGWDRLKPIERLAGSSAEQHGTTPDKRHGEEWTAWRGCQLVKLQDNMLTIYFINGNIY